MFKNRKKIIVILSLALVLVAIIVGMAMKGKKQPPDVVQTAKAGKCKIVETVTATGKIQPVTQVKISADVAAKITQLNIKEGDWVEKGHLLVRLDSERFLAAVEQSEANFRSVEANALLVKENEIRADKDYARTKELFDRNLESKAALDQAYAAVQVEKARYKSALEQVDQAKAAVKQSKEELSKTTIYAPMAGTISKLNKEVGEIALGSQFQEDVIMVISNLAGMEALVNVDENDIVRVSLGDSATIEVDALPNRVFHGTVSEIANSAKVSGAGTTEQKTEFEVKIAISDAGNSLREGMTASADVVTEIRNQVLGVPIQCVTVRTLEQLKQSPAKMAKSDSQAVQYTPDKDGFVPVVFIVANNSVTARQVKTGIQSESHIEIIDGVKEGDEFVTGSYRAISQTLQNHGAVLVQNNGKI